MTYINIHPAGTAFYPQLQLEWAPTTQPTVGTQTYVDITTRLREWSWSYGRNDELGEFEPGSGYVVLDNRDRAFDPSNTAGTWSGNIKPRRAFRLKAKTGGVEYPIFIGYSRGYPQEWPAQGKDGVVRVDLTDRLTFLATYELPVGFSRGAELTGARVVAVLDAIGFPAGASYRAIDPGTVTMAPITVTDAGSNALAHLRECAAAEFGQIYDQFGVLTFADRNVRLQLGFDYFPTYGFRDASGGDGRYDTQLVPRYDDTYLWNDVTVTGPNADDVAGTAAGTASQGDYWPLTKSISSQLYYEPDRTALAQYHVERYEQPALRTAAITFSMGGQVSNTHRANLLTTYVNTAVSVTRFSGSTAQMYLEQWVEGVGHAGRPGGPWTVTLATSPTDANHYWTLETGTAGTIDTTNLIAP